MEHRRFAAGILTLGCLAALLLPGAPVAQAAVNPAACASPTRTISGGGNDKVAVANGEVVLLTGGTFTGKLDPLAAGGTLCVAASATYAPHSVKTQDGDLIVHGVLDLPGIDSGDGFDLWVDGTAETKNVTLNASSTITVAVGGRITSGTVQANAGAAVHVDGTFDARLAIKGGATLTNSGQLISRSGLAIDGTGTNTGRLRVIGGALRFNEGSSFSNLCVIDADDDVTVDTANGVSNAGIIQADPASGTLRVNQNATYTQGVNGVFTSDALDNAGTVAGFGRYRFGRTTHSEASFVGVSAVDPIVVQDLTPPSPPKIFDQQTGTVANTVVGSVPAPGVDDTPGTCAGTTPTPTADLSLTKTGPAEAAPGERISYTIAVANTGPDAATDVTVTDTLPPALGAVSAGGGGNVSAGKVTWQLSTLAADGTANFTVSGTAPASGTLVNTAAASSVTDDPNPENNDGSSSAHQVTTTITSAPAVNNPPVVGNTVTSTKATEPTSSTVVVSDPDQGQQVLASLATRPARGEVTLSGEGVFTYTPTGTTTGVDTFTVQGCDNGEPVLCATGTVLVAVVPNAVQDEATTFEGQPVTISVLSNDIGDVTGGPELAQAPGHGSVSVVGDQLHYTPAAGFTGTDDFTYRICSAGTPPACATAPVSVLVNPTPNRPPSAQDVQLSTSIGVTVAGTVSPSDPDGDPLTATLAQAPGSGTAVVDPDGSFTYTPGSTAGNVTFSIQVCDDFTPPACASATVTVAVSPVAVADVGQTTQDVPVTVDVTANDLGGVGTPQIIIQPVHGTATVEADGRITYVPDAGFVGPDSLRYEVCAQTAATLCDSTVLNLNVGPVPNRPPDLSPMSLVGQATASVSGQLGFDDPDGDPLTFTVSGQAAHGTASVNAAGVVTYTPAGEFTGTDTFVVKACDDATPAECATATVHVTVFPVAGNDEAATDANELVVVETGANDVGAVGAVGAEQITTPPTHGSAVVVSSIEYTPEPTFVGVDELTYQICSSTPGDEDICASATVSITVLPVLANDAISTLATTAVTENVLANDTAGDDAVVSLVTGAGSGPTHGTVSLNGSLVTYTPRGSFTGHDAFVYQVCSPSSSPARSVCAQASVSVSVRPLLHNDAATTQQGVAVTIDVRTNDVGDADSPVVVDGPANGTVTGGGLDRLLVVLGGRGRLAEIPTLEYTPNAGFVGQDVFRYVRCSPGDTTLCSAALVVVTVLPDETTTTTTTTSSTTSTSATTPPPTTTGGGGANPSTTGGAGQLPGAGGGAQAAAGSGLPITGMDVLTWLVAGGILLGVGGLLVFASRPKPRRH